jgi:hypothetical protein
MSCTRTEKVSRGGPRLRDTTVLGPFAATVSTQALAANPVSASDQRVADVAHDGLG